VSWLLAYTPFIDPLDLHEWWWLTLGPLALGISIAYKAVRVPDFTRYWREVGVMTVQIILGMIGLSIFVYLLIEVFFAL